MPDKSHCITLKDRPDVTKYVETLLKDYSKEPQNTRFDGIISPPSSTRNIPKVFVGVPSAIMILRSPVIGTIRYLQAGGGRTTL